MSLRYLVDTNVLSEPIKPVPDLRLVNRLHDQLEATCTASPVWHELLYGCRRLPSSGRRRALERYIHEVVRPHLPILPYGEEAAAWHAAERARLERAGRTPSFTDGQIAAVAATIGLTLVTANASDFEPFRGLVIEDWHEV